MTIATKDCIFCNGTGKQNEHRSDNNDPLGRAINESNRYQALLFQAWQTMRGQTKGLQRQRRLINRLRKENTDLRQSFNRMQDLIRREP
jgi:hypothetical protein